jgi:two-component sensor histidine kinase
MPDYSEPVLNRGELQELHARFREIKHNINNTLAVIMALSELGQRNPAHLEKLAKSVLQRAPEVVELLNSFGDQLSANLRDPAAVSANGERPNPYFGTFD